MLKIGYEDNRAAFQEIGFAYIALLKKRCEVTKEALIASLQEVQRGEAISGASPREEIVHALAVLQETA